MSSDVFALDDNEALYRALGVPRTASDAQIKKAYFQLAVAYHPDKNVDGEEKFKEVSFAYGILSDPEQRQMYDAKTLKGRVVGEARSYDPMMDPDVELSPDQLRFFVEQLRARDREDTARRLEFASRMEEERKRRAAYDERRGVALPSLSAGTPSAGSIWGVSAGGRGSVSQISTPAVEGPAPHSGPASSGIGGFRTTADLLTELRSEKKATDVPRTSGGPSTAAAPSPCSGTASSRPHYLSVKEQMLRNHAQTTAAQRGTRNPPSSKLPFVQEEALRPSYTRDVVPRVLAASNFNYRGFIENDLIDGGAVGDAILSDALSGYVKLRKP